MLGDASAAVARARAIAAAAARLWPRLQLRLRVIIVLTQALADGRIPPLAVLRRRGALSAERYGVQRWRGGGGSRDADLDRRGSMAGAPKCVARRKVAAVGDGGRSGWRRVGVGAAPAHRGGTVTLRISGSGARWRRGRTGGGRGSPGSPAMRQERRLAGEHHEGEPPGTDRPVAPGVLLARLVAAAPAFVPHFGETGGGRRWRMRPPRGSGAVSGEACARTRLAGDAGPQAVRVGGCRSS